jgi:hypothetical protein
MKTAQAAPSQKWRNVQSGAIVKIAWVDAHGVHFKTRSHQLKHMVGGAFYAQYVPSGT